jgi:hypothetical protein
MRSNLGKSLGFLPLCLLIMYVMLLPACVIVVFVGESRANNSLRLRADVSTVA